MVLLVTRLAVEHGAPENNAHIIGTNIKETEQLRGCLAAKQPPADAALNKPLHEPILNANARRLIPSRTGAAGVTESALNG